MKMNPKDILVPTISLFVICLVATLLLAVVNGITLDKIAEQTAKSEAEARVAVLQDATDFNEKDGYYEGIDANGNVVGYVFNCVGTSKGYGGEISVTVGIDKDGVVTGIVPGDLSNETPGLGQNALKNSFKAQFIGKSGTIGVAKSAPAENEIQALTSATITSKAVTSAVNVALEEYAQIGGADNG